MVQTRTELRWPVISAGVVLVALDIYGFLGSLLLTLMRCDEGCTGEGWSHTPGAWQWDAFPILSGMALLASGVGVASALRRRAGDAHIAYALSVGAMLVWFAIYASA
jgi:hypothetical protein